MKSSEQNSSKVARSGLPMGQEQIQAAIFADTEKAIFSEDIEGKITSWSPGAEALFGYSASEVIGKSSTLFVPPSQIQVEVDVRSRVLSGMRISHFEAVWVDKLGRALGISMLLFPLKDAKGRILGLYRIAHESLDWRKAPDNIHASVSMVDYSQNSIISVDNHGVITSWNKAAERIFGYTAKEAVGQHISFFIPPEHQQKEEEILKKILTGQSVLLHETCRRCKDGSLAYGVATISPILDANDRIVGASRLAMDITERRNSEEKMQLLVQALDASNNGIIITDVGGSIQWVNGAFTRMTGFSIDEIKGKDVSVLRSGKQDSEFFMQIWKTILQGNVWHGEMTSKRKNGSFYEEEMTITPIRNADGKLTHFIALKQDISEKVHSFKEKERLQAQVKEAYNLIQTLAGLLPVCVCCKQVRRDEGYLRQLDSLLRKHPELGLKLSMCPECNERLFQSPESEIGSHQTRRQI